jgi:hypothetical protein
MECTHTFSAKCRRGCFTRQCQTLFAPQIQKWAALPPKIEKKIRKCSSRDGERERPDPHLLRKKMEPWERSERGGVKKTKTPPAPPVAALTDHLLGEILRRLPDMASLLSAALSCKRWGRVASNPAVFRRFLSLRRPPLVGFILTDRGAKPVPFHDPDVCFITASPRHPKLASAASHRMAISSSKTTLKSTMAIHAMTMAGASVAATAASSSSPVAAMGMISPSTILSSGLSSSLENPSYPPLPTAGATSATPSSPTRSTPRSRSSPYSTGRRKLPLSSHRAPANGP